MKKISMETVNNACLQIAEKIKAENVENIELVAVSRGGLIPATIIAHHLNLKDIKFIRLSSYSDEGHLQSEIQDTTSDTISNTPSTYIIDDICDSGETLQYLRQRYPSTKIFTLINKNNIIEPDFAALHEDKNVWINFPWEVEDL